MNRLTLAGRYCYYYVINFQYSDNKTKTADGRMRHTEARCYWLTAAGQALLSAVLIGRAAESLWLIARCASRSNKNRPLWNTRADWPATLSVLSRGIVMIISLDKIWRTSNLIYCLTVPRHNSEPTWEMWQQIDIIMKSVSQLHIKTV